MSCFRKEVIKMAKRKSKRKMRSSRKKTKRIPKKKIKRSSKKTAKKSPKRKKARNSRKTSKVVARPAKRRSRKPQIKPSLKWHAAPLKGSFMATAMLGFLISAYWVYPQSFQYGIAFMVVFAVMFLASMVSMTKAPLPPKYR